MLEKLKQDMVEAMKSKDKKRLAVIRMVKAAVDKEHIDKKRELNDDLVIDVVNKQIKMRKDSINEFTKAGRDDLVEDAQKEMDYLKVYLPEQLSREDVMQVIDSIFEEMKPSGKKDMGNIMKEAASQIKGCADMQEVSEIVKEKLQ